MFIKRNPLFFFLLFTLVTSFAVKAEDVFEEEEEEATTTEVTTNNVQLVTESVKKISPSQKIFILSNTNASFGKGDFLTLIMNNELVVRVLCAKQLDDLAGVKVVKTYSADLWQKVKEGTEVQVLRGDDSQWKTPKKEVKKAKDNSKIKDEDDLYNETKLDDDTTFDENKNRSIKTDNVIALGYGLVDARNNDGSKAKAGQFMGTWAYQVTDNIWGELGYGQGILNDYPATSLDTQIRNFMFRLKYTFTGPLYSHILPYVGYQMITASSPGAGSDSSGEVSAEQLNQEISNVEALKKNSLIAGVTILKRLVPGWFLRADIGTDTIGGGIALEF